MRKATKAAGSIYYKIRMEAAEYNERFYSREGASEAIGIDRTRLARIELESVDPYPEEVLMMSDVYNAPELCHHYCKEQCALGKHTVPEAELVQLDRLAIKILSSFKDVDDVKESLIDICEDGAISESEEPRLEEILISLDKIASVAQSLKLWAGKYVK